MKFNRNIFLAIGLLFSVMILRGQTIPYKLYTPHDGLAQSQVVGMFQDSRGYIWTGTKDGLSYFNGEKFTKFNATNGLPATYISRISEDKNGDIRFFTGKWLCKYDGKSISYDTMTVRFYDEQFCMDNDKTIWTINAKDRFLYYSKDWKTWHCASQESETLKNIKWDFLNFDAHFDRLILLGERAGTYSFKSNALKKIFHTQIRLGVEKPNSKRQMFAFCNDSLLQLEADTVRLIRKIPKYALTSCIVKEDGRIFFLANGFGQMLYSLKPSGLIDSLLLKEAMSFLFLDKDDNVWCGSEQGLLRIFVNGFQMFDQNKLYSIWSMTEDNAGKMYFGSYYRKDIIRFDGRKFDTLHINPIKSNEKNGGLGDFYFGGGKDGKGNLYFPMSSGIMKYNGQKFSYFGKPTEKGAISMFFYLDDKRNKIVSGTDGGVNVIDLATEATKYYGADKGLHRTGYVLGVTKDNQGHYWLATGAGVARLDLDKDTIDRNYTRNLKNFPYYGSLAIHADFKGTIWAGSRQGLLRYDDNTNSFALVAPNIIRSSITSLTPYKDKYLVVGTRDGVYFLDLQAFYTEGGKTVVRVFNQHNGYLGIEPNQNCIYVDAKDNVWIAASDIVTKITPSELDMSPKPLTPYITTINDTSILYAQYNQVINLPYGQNTAKIRFEAVGFERPFNTEFSWKLDNGKWSDWRTDDFTVLDNLGSDVYTFHVRTRPAGTVGEDAIKETVIRFKISIPPYRERNFPFYALLAAMIVGFVIWQYVQEQRQRAETDKRQYEDYKKKQEEIEKERTRHMKYLQIQTLQAQLNPHFIFNILQAVQTRIYEGSRDSASSLIVDLANLIRRFLESSINMDMARMRNTEITLRQEINLLRSYIEFEQLQYSNRFDYTIYVDDAIDAENVLMPPMLIQPYVENAIKHGILYEKERRCRLDVIFTKTDDDRLVCCIKDNGIGRERAKEIQSQSIRMYKSRGTQILEDRIRIMQELGQGISIETYDNPEGGTIVELKLDM